MEFLPYSEVLSALDAVGIQPQADGDDLIRFELNPSATARAATISVEQLHLRPGIDPDSHNIDLPTERLAAAVDHLVYHAHLGEAIVIPVGKWRNILDLAAFELAKDEDWIDIDAEATLHQNSRDPLAVRPKKRKVVSTMVEVLVSSGTEPNHDLTITAVDVPIVIEVRHDPAVIVTCAVPGLIDSLATAVIST